MAFGFPAYHTERFPVTAFSTSDLRAAVEEAVYGLSWTLKERSNDRIIAKTRWSDVSSGETVSIDFLPDQSIQITSKGLLPTQCFDSGKNELNIGRLVIAIMKQG